MFKAGDQVPAMPLLEVVGKAAKVSPGQIAATGEKVGTMLVFTKPPGATQLEVAPVKVKLTNVALLLSPEASVAVVMAVLSVLAKPWLKWSWPSARLNKSRMYLTS